MIFRNREDLVRSQLPRRLRQHLPAHGILTAREMKWEQLRNGARISAAVEAGFDAILTIDKQLEYQQRLTSLPLPVVVVDGKSNALPDLIPFVPSLLKLLNSPLDIALYVVQENGEVLRLTEPLRRSA